MNSRSYNWVSAVYFPYPVAVQPGWPQRQTRRASRAYSALECGATFRCRLRSKPAERIISIWSFSGSTHLLLSSRSTAVRAIRRGAALAMLLLVAFGPVWEAFEFALDGAAVAQTIEAGATSTIDPSAPTVSARSSTSFQAPGVDAGDGSDSESNGDSCPCRCVCPCGHAPVLPPVALAAVPAPPSDGSLATALGLPDVSGLRAPPFRPPATAAHT